MKQRPNCKLCKDRTLCTTPCDALLRFLDRSSVTIKQRELTIGIPTYSKMAWPTIDSVQHLTVMEKIYLTLEACGVPRRIVAKVFGIKYESVRRMIYSAKSKLRN